MLLLDLNKKRLLGPYIRSNTYFRIISQSDFNKGTDKRLSKPVFGKSIQNENNDIDLRFVTNKKMRNKYTSSKHTKKMILYLQLIEKQKKSSEIK